MKTPAKLSARRRKPKASSLHVLAMGDNDSHDRYFHLMKMTVKELKKLLRAAGIGIPKEKWKMAHKLAKSDAVVVVVTTEAAVL